MVNLLRFGAGRLQTYQIRRVELMKHLAEGPDIIITDPGIDKNNFSIKFDDPRVHAEDDVAPFLLPVPEHEPT